MTDSLLTLMTDESATVQYGMAACTRVTVYFFYFALFTVYVDCLTWLKCHDQIYFTLCNV